MASLKVKTYVIQKGNIDDPEVTKEDQGYINEFSRLFAKNKIIDSDIKRVDVFYHNLGNTC